MALPTRCTGRTLLVTALLLLAFGPAPAWATAGDATADRVLGQPSFSESGLNRLDGQGLFSPEDVAIDGSATPNRIYVADSLNGRVLGWSDASGFASGAPADLVIGQPDFVSSACSLAASASNLCDPRGIAVDELGNLYVADREYHRVLEYDTPFTTDGVADRVFGQADFTTRDCNGENGVPSLTTLCSPLDVVVDGAGNLYVADVGNNRVLGYEAPFLAGTTADLIIGGTACTPVSATSLCGPSALAIDFADNLYVADTGNNRVLEYGSPITADTTADRVFGQGNSFTVGACNGTPVRNDSSLCFPQGVVVDGAGNVVVADTGNRRILLYDAPDVNGTVADRVLGQAGDFTTAASSCESEGLSPSASTFCEPLGVALDADGDLYVADASNHRVLAFDAPVATDAAAGRVLGQTSLTHGGANLVDARGVFGPAGLAIDRSSTPARLYAVDRDNSRVLAWANAAGFASGAPADLAIGQPDLASSGCNTGGRSASTLCFPHAVAVDAAGRLSVADAGNNRVLQYDAPFTTDTVADRVLGQNGSFATNDCAAGASGLCTPNGVAVDAAGNLWVADTGNSRVLEYHTPLATDTTADRVFGQRGSFTTIACSHLGAIDAQTLCQPRGVAVDGAGNLFVADDDDSRVLQYDAPLTSDATADRVFGQHGSFTTDGCDLPDADSLCAPVAVLIDGAGNLYVADRNNSRVLEYDTPLTAGTTADRVFGQQGSFATGDCGVGADGLCHPEGIAIDATGTLYVADTSNHRILSYDTPLPLTPSAAKAARQCQLAIVKAGAAFVQAELKTLQKCEDAKVKRKLDICPDAKTTAAVLKGKTKLGSVIAKACCGKDKQCTGAGDDQTLVDIGWNVGHCPTFARGACANPIAHAGDVATCLTCLGDAAVADVLDFAYGALVPIDPKLQKALNGCQQAIGKAATTFVTVSSKAIAKCWDAVGKGKAAGPCPDGAAQTKIAAAEAKKVAKICKACGGGGDKTPADGQCDAASPLNPGIDIGFPPQCPARQVPGGTDCAAIGAIVTLDDVIDCVDCVASSSADCANRGAVPAFTPYPLECRP